MDKPKTLLNLPFCKTKVSLFDSTKSFLSFISSSVKVNIEALLTTYGNTPSDSKYGNTFFKCSTFLLIINGVKYACP